MYDLRLCVVVNPWHSCVFVTTIASTLFVSIFQVRYQTRYMYVQLSFLLFALTSLYIMVQGFQKAVNYVPLLGSCIFN